MDIDQEIGKMKVMKIQDCWMSKQQNLQHTFVPHPEVKQSHLMTMNHLNWNQNQFALIPGLKCLDWVLNKTTLSPRTWDRRWSRVYVRWTVVLFIKTHIRKLLQVHCRNEVLWWSCKKLWIHMGWRQALGKLFSIRKRKYLTEVGFEPTPPKRLEP